MTNFIFVSKFTKIKLFFNYSELIYYYFNTSANNVLRHNSPKTNVISYNICNKHNTSIISWMNYESFRKFVVRQFFKIFYSDLAICQKFLIRLQEEKWFSYKKLFFFSSRNIVIMCYLVDILVGLFGDHHLHTVDSIWFLFIHAFRR